MPMTQKEFEQKLTQSIDKWKNIELNDFTLKLSSKIDTDEDGNTSIDKDKNKAALKDWKKRFDTISDNLSNTVELLLSYGALPKYCSDWSSYCFMSTNRPIRRGYEVSNKLRELAAWIYKCGQPMKTSFVLREDAFLIQCYLKWEDVFNLVDSAAEKMVEYLNKYWKDLNNKGWCLEEANSECDWWPGCDAKEMSHGCLVS